MPLILGSKYSNPFIPFRSQKKPKEYTNYPDGSNLKPGTEHHDNIVQALRSYILDAYHTNSRRDEWDEVDKMLKVYVRTDADLKKDSSKGNIDKIVLPTSYVNLETIMSYMVSALLPDPIWKFIGTGPEDELKARLMTQLVSLHAMRFNMAESLITILRSMYAYGIGIGHAVWNNDVEFGVRLSENGRRQKYKIHYEGNDVVPIDPRTFVFDPNTTINKIQNGDYVAWTTRRNYTYLHNLEANNSKFFNVSYLNTDGHNTFVNEFYSVKEDSNLGTNYESPLAMPIDITYVYANIIPAYWKLGKSENPEKWFFAIAGGNVLIAANKLDLFHNKYPISIGAPDTDGFSNSPLSRLALTQDLQQHINFLFSSHIANLKVALNNRYIVDPFTVNVADLKKPGPGSIIRLKKGVWGKAKVGDYLAQLPINDVTRQNMEEVGYMTNLIQEVTKATEQAKGQLVNRGPRISSTQAQNAFASSLGGLEKDAYRIGQQFMQPLGRLFVSHTQQFMSQEVFLTVAGELAESLKRVFPDKVPANNQIGVNYQNILGSPFDVEVRDGTIPGRVNAQTLVQLLQVSGAVPNLLAGLDIKRFFLDIAYELGVKNVEKYILPEVEIAPEENIERQVRSGNLQAL